MKKLKFLLIILLIGTICSCENDIIEDVGNNTADLLNKDFEIHKLETEYDFNSFSKEDQLKITIGESLENLLISDKEYARDFLHKLVDNNKTKEFLYIEKKNVSANKTARSKNSEKSLESLLISHIYSNSSTQNKGNSSEKQKRISLIERAETILPNLVIKIPDWANVVLENVDLEKLDYAVYSGINTKDLSFQYKNRNNLTYQTLADYIPIQIKESEQLIPVKKNSNKTLWGDDLFVDHFPSLNNCPEFKKKEYVKYSDNEYDFIDRTRLNEDLINVKLCGIDIEDDNGSGNNSCNKVYERDCVNEKNVIEGLKFVNYANLLTVNNQPGGEDVFTLHYNFTVASMCGNLETTEVCPPNNWKLVISGRFDDFFETQFHWGSPTDTENISFTGKTFWSKYYIKSIPKYYDIPVAINQEQIYSQVRYLDLTPNASWDGNEYGHAISLAIYEHDDVIVKESTTNSITITNSTKISGKLKIGEKFETAADFSNSVKRTSSTTINIEASKDVDLGIRALNYYSENYNLPYGGYGYYISTGSISTHFAIYY
ncbi:hypothetical protein N8354_02875 [Flavobacteriaceae bacterium]|nr:hypothetical protein [Flavobacteriaceae bacterium]